MGDTVGAKPEPDAVSFGVFEFRLTVLELYKHGIRIKLQEQPSRVLALLVRNPGQIVSRERIQQELWPDATFGEFDAGLNTALSKLRAVLGDSAVNSIFVERVPRQGYRFLAPVVPLRPGIITAPAAIALGEPTPLEQPRESAPVSATPWRPSKWLALAGLSAAVLCVAVANRAAAPGPATSPVRFSILLPPGQKLHMQRRAVGVSDDGSTLGYLATNGTTTQVFVRRLDEPEFKAVPGTAGTVDFLLSPDGRQVLFFAAGKWTKIGVSGKDPILVANTSQPLGQGAAWGADGSIYIGDGEIPGQEKQPSNSLLVYRVRPGQAPQRMTPAPAGETRAHFPQQLLSGRDELLISDNGSARDRRILAVSRDGKQSRLLAEPAMGGFYLEPGHLVYWWSGSVLAAPFSLAKMAAIGPAVPVIDRVAPNGWIGGQISISSTGTVAYVPAPSEDRILAWRDRNGDETPLDLAPAPCVLMGLSPSGSKILVHRIDGAHAGVWMYDRSERKWTRLVAGVWPSTTGVWSPDEKSVVFSATLQGETFENMYLMSINPPGAPERIVPSKYGQFAQAWTASAGLIYTESDRPVSHIDLYRLTMDGRSQPQPLVTTTGHDSLASPSPDGRWIAYSSTVSGQWEVYLHSLRDPAGAPIQISKGGCCPLWPPSGDEIVYRAANGVWSVKFAGGMASQPVRLFDRKFAGWTVWNREYALDADGKRFLVAKAVSEPDDDRRINVVLNWSSELERLLPSGR